MKLTKTLGVLLGVIVFAAPVIASAAAGICSDNSSCDTTRQDCNDGSFCYQLNSPPAQIDLQSQVQAQDPTPFAPNSDGSFSPAAAPSTGAGLNLDRLSAFADSITQFINVVLVPLLVAVAFIVFLYGVFNYFIKGGADEEAHKTGRTFILYGIIGFVVILSIWGLVNIVRELIGYGPQSQINHPAYPRL